MRTGLNYENNLEYQDLDIDEPQYIFLNLKLYEYNTQIIKILNQIRSKPLDIKKYLNQANLDIDKVLYNIDILTKEFQNTLECLSLWELLKYDKQEDAQVVPLGIFFASCYLQKTFHSFNQRRFWGESFNRQLVRMDCSYYDIAHSFNIDGCIEMQNNYLRKKIHYTSLIEHQPETAQPVRITPMSVAQFNLDIFKDSVLQRRTFYPQWF
ncbi:MAG: hypothetical protein OXF85_02655 [Candidatus Saccharibacteria bacterium]|nr:hypothetical protein [Candidatus Saccharibacteria bacterium]